MSDKAQYGKVRSQKRLIARRELANGATMKDALLTAGYSESTAAGQPARITDPIRTGLAAALERRGFTDEKFAEQIEQGTVAEKADGSPEWFARLGYHKLIASCRGDEAPKKFQHDHHLNAQAVRREQSRLEEALEWLE